MKLLEVQDLRVSFGAVRAVDGVSFAVERGEVLGIAGESGAGKSLVCMAVLGLVPPPGDVEARSIRFEGRELRGLSERELRKVRGREIALVFQDPAASLNPLLPIGIQVAEMLEVHRGLARRDARREAARALGDVGLPRPEELLARFPHELSGGQRQRVVIAAALAPRPKLVLADEPTSSLDVTLAAEVLELFARVRERHGTAIVLITHSLGVLARHADRCVVMYAGRVVEEAGALELLSRPRHPYTRGLLASVPTLAGDPSARIPSIPGGPPEPGALPTGCAFRPRCALALPRCADEPPELELVAPHAADHRAACFAAADAAVAAGAAR